MYWLIAYQWLYTAMMLLALIASLRYTRLSKSSPLLSGGFGLALAVNLLSKIASTLGPRFLHLSPLMPNSFSPYSPPLFYCRTICARHLRLGFGGLRALRRYGRGQSEISFAATRATRRMELPGCAPLPAQSVWSGATKSTRSTNVISTTAAIESTA